MQKQAMIHFYSDNDAHVPLPDDYVNYVDNPRASEDANMPLNKYGRKLLNLCISSGLSIMSGHTAEDIQVGKYTCLTSRCSSRLHVITLLLCKDAVCQCLDLKFTGMHITLITIRLFVMLM